MAGKLDLKASTSKLKEWWKKQPAKKRRIFYACGGGVLCTVLLLAVISGLSKMNYQVLFPGMDNQESIEVYATLQEMGVQARMDSSGQILVPKDQWENLVFELNGQGYPKTTLSYDTFTSLSGFTTTEFEKKAGLIFQAQDRMQDTLERQEGIRSATVTFTVPESSNYIWDQSNQQKSSGSVSVEMAPGYELTPERVSAIKHLAATSVPKLAVEDVVVVDASTGVEMPGVEDASEGGYYSLRRLEYEEAISRQIEDKVRRLLAGKYGADGVTAVATVTLDYDKMVSETKQFQAQDGTNNGVISHFDERYTLDGNVAAEGLVGEEDNTDAPPLYPTVDGDENATATDYQRNIDYEVGYILTQIEKGEPIIDRASVAVVVNDPSFNEQVEETLVDLVSKAVNITPDNIRVTNLDYAIMASNPQPSGNGGLSQRQLLLLALGGAVLALVVILAIVLLVLRSRKKKRQAEEEAEEEAERQRQAALQKEIEDHKRMLRDEAEASANAKENAITDEIRSFAEQNPEVAAALLRSIMREDK